MGEFEFSIEASNVEISKGNYNTLIVNVSGVRKSELMSVLSIVTVEDIVNCYNYDELLSAIGEEAIHRYSSGRGAA